MLIRTTLRIVLLLIAATGLVSAQHHNFRVYGSDSGLTGLDIEDIAQDPQGYLWVTSQGGLFRFDGENFEPQGDSVGLPWFWCESLHFTPDGALWISSHNGLFEQRNGEYRAVPVPAKGMSRGKRTIDSDADGSVYLATQDGLLVGRSSKSPRQWSRVWPPPSAPPQAVSGVKSFSSSEIWFSCAQSICLWNGQRVQEYGPRQGVAPQEWFAFAKDGQGHLLARSSDHLLEWVPAQGRWVRADAGLSRSTERKPLFIDQSGRVFVPTDAGLAVRLARGWKYLTRKNGLPVNVVTSLFEDREGNIWAGTYGGGVALWIGQREWLAWTEAEGLPSEEVWSIVPESPSRYWIGTSRGVAVLEQGSDEWTLRALKSALTPPRVIAMARDQQGHLWVPAATEGFYRADNYGSGARTIGGRSGIKGPDVNFLLADSDNRLWVASDKGLFRSTRLNEPDVRFDPVSVPGQNQPGAWWNLTRAADGTVWAAGLRGLMSVRDGIARLYTAKDGLLADAVFVSQPVKGEVWLAYDSHAGITRLSWDGGRLHVSHFRSEAEHRTDRLYSMAADSAGRLYVGTGNGLLIYDGHDWSSIDTSDGLIWPDCSQGGLTFDSQGALWIGTSRGLSRYRPEHSREHRPPVVFADASLPNGRTFPAGSPPQLPYTGEAIDFNFRGLTFTNWAKVLFRYRLAGLEESWVETHSQTVHYPKLQPGKYVFEVQMRSSEGVWSEHPARIPFEVLTPWWRTFWMIGVYVALLGLAGQLLYWWRMRRLQAHEQELQAAVQRGRQEIEGQKLEIERLLEKSEQANRAKSEFLANVSHELRTPLTGVIGLSDLILQGELEAIQREHLQVLRQSATGLLGILNDILDLSKVEIGRMDLRLEGFDLRECVQASVQTLSATAQGKGIALTSEWLSDVPPRVVGDPLRLRQILLNLLGNAVKFTSSGSVLLQAVCRRLEPANESGAFELQFSVSDTGIGIPPSQQERIFEAFHQADNSLSREFGGTGLGLAICKRLASLMDGDLRVVSEVGRGSVFHVTLKMREASATPAQPATQPPAQADLRPRRILLVEDNPVNRKVVVGLLSKYGHTIDSVGNGKEALEALAKGIHDLVLMDVQMPVMDGLEATRRIRAMEVGGARHLPIIGLTALAMKGDHEVCLAAGMDECLHKPIELAALLSAIEQAGQLDGSRPVSG